MMKILLKNPSATSAYLAENIGVAKRTIERAFKALREKRMIECTGSKRDGNWTIIR